MERPRPSYEGTFIADSPLDLQLEIEKFAHGCPYVIQEKRGEVNLAFRDVVVRLGLIGVTSLTFPARMETFHNNAERGINAIFELQKPFNLRVVGPWTVAMEIYYGRYFNVATFPWCVGLAHALIRVYLALEDERSR